MFSKGYPLEAKNAPKNRNQSVHMFWARLASFGHSGIISDHLIFSKFHNETLDPKGQENKIYTIVKPKSLKFGFGITRKSNISSIFAAKYDPTGQTTQSYLSFSLDLYICKGFLIAKLILVLGFFFYIKPI